jgi:hypothetical protein
MPPFFFESIIVPTPRNEIFRRLGYRKGKTRLSSSQAHEIESYIDDALADIQLKGAGVHLPIMEKMDSETFLSSGQVIRSSQIAAMLARSGEILLIGATAGPKIMEAIRQDSAHNNLTRAIVLDAVGSEMADAAFDWIIGYFNHEFSRERRQLTKKRFSAGYGDFSLDNQRWIHQALMLDCIGVSITESCMLTPEKSVTAVLGIEEID